ncbi:2Fe-2S iron-sulfur cluster-binding protein [Gammaproteobacteria bacterium]|nr:2Fe-2S iron-sulfur cluster-binding protein [Gammaproteobacteria bacterium]
MSFIKTNSGKEFEQIDGESILSSAKKAGINFQYSCKNGRCSTCKCILISGNTQTYSDEIGLTKSEKEDGYILSCVRYAASNIEIEVDDLGDIEIPKEQVLPSKINSLKMLSEDVIQVILRIPPNTRFNIIPGQYVDIVGPNNVKRSYSIANHIVDNLIELHIKKVINGELSDYWFKDAKPDDLLRLRGPYGTFFLRESKKDIIFLATGTGIAPVKSMLDNLEKSKNIDDLNIYLIWGGRKASDLYLDFSNKYKNLNLKYIPVLSRPDSSWHGSVGYVHKVLLEQNFNLAEYNVYACGLDKMISDANMLLTEKGLQNNSFFSDAFVAS